MSRLRALGAAANDNRWVSAAVRSLPEPVFRRVAHAVGGRLPEPIDTAPLKLLDGVDMADAAALEHDVLPRLGLADDVPHVFPAHLQPHVGTGVRAWQYPSQFAPYLAAVAARGVRSYLEIGVRHGGTFLITVTALRPDEAVAVDLDTVPALEGRPGVTFLRTDSRSRRFRRFLAGRTFDLVLVDGNHAYEAVRSDIQTVLAHARMIALHDIVDDASPGVRRAWAELRSEHAADFEFAEFTAQYDEVRRAVGAPVLGIGLAARRAPSR